MESLASKGASRPAETGGIGAVLADGYHRALPREHGAWAALGASFFLGAGTGRVISPEMFVFLLVVLSAFLARSAASAGVRASRNRGVLPGRIAFWGIVDLGVTAGGAVVLIGVWRLWRLLAFGGAAALVFGISLLLEAKRKDHTPWGEILGMLGLTLVTPAAAYVANRTATAETLELWILAALFFCGSVFRVRYRVRKKKMRIGPLRGRFAAGWPSLAYHGAAVAVLAGIGFIGSLGAGMSLALVPVFAAVAARVFLPSKRIVTVRRVGFEELAQTVVFLAVALLLYPRTGG